MVERVARAVFEQYQAIQYTIATNELAYGRREPVTWEFICGPNVVLSDAEGWRDKARAAIDAMREPTKDMLGVVGPLNVLPSEGTRAFVARTWPNMIDAALKEDTHARS